MIFTTANLFPDDDTTLASSQNIHPDPTDQATSITTSDPWDINFQKQGPVFKRIPKASRLHACKSFTSLVVNVTEKNDKDSWEKLFNFARCGIGSSKRGGKKTKSQATVINNRHHISFIYVSMLTKQRLSVKLILVSRV